MFGLIILERNKMKYVVAALYKFTCLENFEKLREPLLEKMRTLDVKGTLLLAPEGINGTISGSRENIDAILGYLKSYERLSDLKHKESYADEHPFYRAKVKLKKEIVTLGVEGIDPIKHAGTYLKPNEWNKLLNDPEVVLIDTRNDYEVKIGTFKGAVNPGIKSFRQLPEWVNKNLDSSKHKKVAMFCTGGIRCEKSTSLLNKMGFENVYHLQEGILKYFEETDEKSSMWQGECFVFDQRVSVNQNLNKGSYDQCYACRMPLSDEDKKSDKYVKGVSCPHCFDESTKENKERFSERAKQMRLAKERGDKHMYDGHIAEY